MKNDSASLRLLKIMFRILYDVNFASMGRIFFDFGSNRPVLCDLAMSFGEILTPSDFAWLIIIASVSSPFFPVRLFETVVILVYHTVLTHQPCQLTLALVFVVRIPQLPDP